MTPKEKGIYLVTDVFDPTWTGFQYSWTGFQYSVAIKCVEEIIKSHTNDDGSITDFGKVMYWTEVREELKKQFK